MNRLMTFAVLAALLMWGLATLAQPALPDNCTVAEGEARCYLVTNHVVRPDYVPEDAAWSASCEWAVTEWRCEVVYWWDVVIDPLTSPLASPLRVERYKVYLPVVDVQSLDKLGE